MLIKPLNREHSLESWTFVNGETFLFFERLYLSHVREYETISEKSDDKYYKYLEVSNLRSVLLVHFCAMCEGILNNYGTLKLGESFYKDHIEFVNPFSKKAAEVKSICTNTEIKRNTHPLNEIQKLFDARNDFIHPKHKETLKENIWERKEINYSIPFTKDDPERLKSLITELLDFLTLDEEDAHFLYRKYNWKII